jgi:hypothetical protein
MLLVSFALLVASHLAVPTPSTAQNADEPEQSIAQSAKDEVAEQIDDVAKKVDQDERAKSAKESIIGKIYEAAEYLSFPAFYWIAFALMTAGLVSFLGQLVLGKLIMLAQFHFSLTEVLSDLLGLLISAVGLVMVTQAATENSNFTESPFMVLSATAVGVFFGLVFYIRGQTQEFRELREVRRKKKP